VRAEFGSPLQKAIQLVFAWVVPFVGSIIIIAVLRATLPKRERCFDSGSLGSSWMPGIGPESESALGHHSQGESGGDGGHGGDAGFGGH
jgi:hypothetical protein